LVNFGIRPFTISSSTLDIILPIYNPKGDWSQDIIRQYTKFIKSLPQDVTSQLIMVNDGSTENLEAGQALISQAFPESSWLSYSENKGKGHALRVGVASSTSDYLIYTDYDFPYTTSSMRDFVELLHVQDMLVIVGHRDVAYYKDLPWFRVKVSHYLKTINTSILGLNTDDTQCGLKGFHHSLKDMFLETKTNRFLIDIEFMRILKKADIEVTVYDVHSRPGVVMSTLGFRTIISELWNYSKILFST